MNPSQILLGEAQAKLAGFVFTTIVIVDVAVQPFAVVPVTVTCSGGNRCERHAIYNTSTPYIRAPNTSTNSGYTYSGRVITQWIYRSCCSNI
ncbi:MAG: hypothetical protein IPI22_14170 [Bacteroidetes bacterium]|nr:hypothetical protein [Bacteroidota bacterium]